MIWKRALLTATSLSIASLFAASHLFSCLKKLKAYPENNLEEERNCAYRTICHIFLRSIPLLILLEVVVINKVVLLDVLHQPCHQEGGKHAVIWKRGRTDHIPLRSIPLLILPEVVVDRVATCLHLFINLAPRRLSGFSRKLYREVIVIPPFLPLKAGVDRIARVLECFSQSATRAMCCPRN
ncbi:hypothetical protein VTO42DRAFT_3879 [Malbranchea cinnamomea]